jgi:hypothetical protein
VFLKVPPLTKTKLSGVSPEGALATTITSVKQAITIIAVKMNSFLIESESPFSAPVS